MSKVTSESASRTSVHTPPLIGQSKPSCYDISMLLDVTSVQCIVLEEVERLRNRDRYLVTGAVVSADRSPYSPPTSQPRLPFQIYNNGIHGTYVIQLHERI